MSQEGKSHGETVAGGEMLRGDRRKKGSVTGETVAGGEMLRGDRRKKGSVTAVSYTHLTLPTRRTV